SVLTTTAVAAFQIAGRVDGQTRVAQAIANGFGRHANHFADGGHPGWGEPDVAQAPLLDEPPRLDEGEAPFPIVKRGATGARPPPAPQTRRCHRRCDCRSR